VDDLLVGFKYVAAALKKLSATGRYGGFTGSLKDFVFAAEESHGVVLTPSIRDKDATPACMLLAGLHAQLKPEGRSDPLWKSGAP
jgi:phosphomannomutase